MGITIEVDTFLGTAYILLRDEAAVAETVHYNDQIQIDLDAYGVAVGVEVLDSSAPLPFTDLHDKFHVHSDVVDLLRMIRPDIDTYLSMSRGHDGVTKAAHANPLTAVP